MSNQSYLSAGRMLSGAARTYNIEPSKAPNNSYGTAGQSGASSGGGFSDRGAAPTAPTTTSTPTAPSSKSGTPSGPTFNSLNIPSSNGVTVYGIRTGPSSADLNAFSNRSSASYNQSGMNNFMTGGLQGASREGWYGFKDDSKSDATPEKVKDQKVVSVDTKVKSLVDYVKRLVSKEDDVNKGDFKKALLNMTDLMGFNNDKAISFANISNLFKGIATGGTSWITNSVVDGSNLNIGGIFADGSRSQGIANMIAPPQKEGE